MKNLNYEGIDLNEKKDIFTNLFLNTNIVEGRLIAVNKKYLSMCWSASGEIVLADPSKPCKIGYNLPRIKANNSYHKIQDIEFSPFNDNILASNYEDNFVALWKIPEGHIDKNITKEFKIYNKHNNKVNYIAFNPVANNVLCSCDLNSEIHIWNPDKSDNYIKFNYDDFISMISWNPNGELIGVSPKNKFLKIFDPRNGKMIFNQKINEGYAPSKLAWIDNNLLATTGWENKHDLTMLKLWDIRKQKDDSLNENEILSIAINKTRRNIFTHKELKIIYIFENDKINDKTNIYLYKYNENKFNKIKVYNLSETSICSVLFNRQILDKNKKEIDRFAICSNLKVNKNFQNISYSSFHLPKESKISDSILYPVKNIC